VDANNSRLIVLMSSHAEKNQFGAISRWRLVVLERDVGLSVIF
jgi:hypothetical protein